MNFILLRLVYPNHRALHRYMASEVIATVALKGKGSEKL